MPRPRAKFGAEGIGLCRTEHMFFDAERIGAVREMIMAETEDGRRDALAQLLPFQREDFVELFRIMAGLPVTIRLLDPPLHEFLPHARPRSAKWRPRSAPTWQRCSAARRSSRKPTRCWATAAAGSASPIPRSTRCRSAPSSRRRSRSAKETGDAPVPEIMIPLVATRRELEITARPGRQDRRRRSSPRPATTSEYYVGTMIELPRAALRADEIAEDRRVLQLRHQRPDPDHLRPVARRRRQVPAALRREGHPAEGPLRLDRQEGVGELVQIAAEQGRAAKPDLKLGICGEHGGDPASIQFCERSRARLRLLLALPRAGRAAGGGPGGAEQQHRPYRLTAGWGRPQTGPIRSARHPQPARTGTR